jgi:predicted permease
VFESLVSDLGFALRSLRKSPGFATVALLTIGLGIGATTLVFSVVHSVLLRPLPYQDSHRLVNVWNDLIEERQFLPAVHPEDFRDYQRMSDTFEEFAAASGAGQVGMAGVLTSDGPPLAVDLSPVTYNFFDLLGVRPVLGRAFTEEEEAFNGPRVAVVSHELWQLRFGGDSSLVGRAIELDGSLFTVVGILPQGFRLLLPEEAFLVKHSDIWVPLQINYEDLPPRNWTWLTVLGRLREGVTLARAQSEMDQIAEELRATYPAHAGSGMQIRLVPFQHDIVKETRLALLTLFGAVGFVLLIACANVAHLLLLRGSARRRELAMRAALGASRGRIARQVFTESVVLGLLGAAVGLVFTTSGLSLLSALQPPNLPRLDEIGINGTVLAFVVGSSLITAIIFGLMPALEASRADVNELLKDGGRVGRSVGAMRVRNVLVIGEIAFSLVLLVATGLMIRTFVALQEVQPGYEPHGVLAFNISLPRVGYGDPQLARGFYTELEGRIRGLPGVEAVGSVSKLPLTGSGVLWPYAYDEKTAASFDLSADGRITTPGYFDAMGTRLVTGRLFTEEDHAEGRRVVIVEEMLAQRAWPGEDPIGKQLQLSRQGENRFATVIGVVEHTRVYDLTRDVREHIYVPHGQRSSRNMSVVMQASVDPLALASLVREAVWAVDANVPVNELRPMSAYVGDAMPDTRFTSLLLRELPLPD